MEIKNQSYKSSDSDFFDFGHYSREISVYLRKKTTEHGQQPVRRIHVIKTARTPQGSNTLLQKRSFYKYESTCSELATDYSVYSSGYNQNPRMVKQLEKSTTKPVYLSNT